MSDRGLPIADGAHACPFVAFDDDRDERADIPDHRHRCYADSPPAPRALAHQEAYCLSSAFPVCPTFQDWARRESARARGDSAARPETPPAADVAPPPPPVAPEPAAAGAAAAAAWSDDEDVPPPPPRYDEGASQRNPPRDWSAPPPWLASAEGGAPQPSEPPPFLASRSQPGQGLAGSTADQWAGGAPPPRATSPAAGSAGSIEAAAAATAAAAAAGSRSGASPYREDHDPDAGDLPTPQVPRRPRAYDQHLGGPSSGPDWERPRRYEAYPTIKTRVGLPDVPRIAVMAAAIGIAALALFFLPAILGLGSPDAATSSPSPSPSPSRSIAPTPTPVPTPIAYVIKAGDTMSKIATDHGLTIDALMAANPEIKDANKIVVGQQIIIPPPEPVVPEPIPGSGAPSAGASP